MASILRALGVTVEGGPRPLSHQVLLHMFPTIMILVCSFCAKFYLCYNLFGGCNRSMLHISRL